MDLQLINKHWEKEFKYKFPKKRKLYDDLLKNIDNQFIITIIGLRRTGKTTLMKQLINYLIEEKNIDSYSVVYYTFDFKYSLLTSCVF